MDTYVHLDIECIKHNEAGVRHGILPTVYLWLSELSFIIVIYVANKYLEHLTEDQIEKDHLQQVLSRWQRILKYHRKGVLCFRIFPTILPISHSSCF